MRTWLLVGFLASMPVVVAAQAEPAAEVESFPQQLAKLRFGMWTEARAGAVIATLLEREHVLAAGWWLEEARSAIAGNKLPRSARKLVKKLDKQMRAKARAVDPEAFRLSDDLARHAEDMIRKKNFEAAEEALAMAEAHLVFFPSAQAESTLKKARCRMPPAEKRSNRSH